MTDEERKMVDEEYGKSAIGCVSAFVVCAITVVLLITLIACLL